MSAQQRTPRRAIVSRLLVSVLILLASFASPPAQAADLLGHDVSWPQCPAPGGYGLPMPPDSTQFVIVGLTKGLSFTLNPCLVSQVQWVTARSKPAHAYGMATYPTSAQLTKYGTWGPWRSTTLAARLSNVGYAQAKDSVAYLSQVGWRPPVVWIDVEPRAAQPWPTGTDAKRALNRAIVEGYMRGLSDSGFGYGLYSYTNGWNEIAGTWKLPNVPVWATAGRLDYPTEAIDRCTQASFSGGRVYISQWYDDTRDYNRTCGELPVHDVPQALADANRLPQRPQRRLEERPARTQSGREAVALCGQRARSVHPAADRHRVGRDEPPGGDRGRQRRRGERFHRP